MIPPSDEYSQEFPLLYEKDRDHGQDKPSSSARTYRSAFAVLAIFFLMSCVLNITLLVTRNASCHDRSRYAGLKTDLSIPFEWATEYANPNLTAAGEIWEQINFDVGMVALPYTWTEKKGLPDAQVFPWDHDQGLYVLNGYHALHCLKNIHRSIREYELGLPQTLPTAHITHCLDSLRGDVLCYADDTPRYTTITKSPETAVGQLRQCRDWNKLEEWAKGHTACYHYINSAADHINQFERFKFCPRDSAYWAKMQEHFAASLD